MSKSSNDTIHVRFFNADTQEQFAESHVPIERLPTSFESATTLHLGEDNWEVARATPITAAEFAVSKKLDLWLRQVTIRYEDPKNILFSLPTISDATPEIEPGSSKLNRNVFEMLEDDWLQISFCSESRRAAIERNLEAIRSIYETQSEGPGFKSIHARTDLEDAVDGLPGAALQECLKIFGAKNLDGISFRDIAGCIANGFAWQISKHCTLYGTQRGNTIQNLALSAPLDPDAPATLKGLSRLMQQHDLLLINWVGAQPFSASNFNEFVTERS